MAISEKNNHFYAFGGFRLEPAQRRFWRGDEPVSLSPKVFDLLVVLVENRGRIVTKEELLQLVWPDSFVEEANLSVYVSVLRKALGERPDSSRFIETIPKRGYRFSDEVEFVRAREEPPPVALVPEPAVATPSQWQRLSPILTLAVLILGGAIGAYLYFNWNDDKPVRSIAVIPFLALGGDGAPNYLGLGMADAIITRLSRLEHITVRPTGSVVRYTNFQGTAMAVGRELEVDAVLQGTVQQADNHIRTTVQLTRVRDGKNLWSDRFDDAASNIFSLQDSIAEKVTAALRMKLTAPERQLLSRRPTASTTAYELYLQGQYTASKRKDFRDRVTAIDFFQKAVDLDPDFALAYAAIAESAAFIGGAGWDGDLGARAKSAALRALFLDDKLPEAHLGMAQVLLRIDWDWNGCSKELDRAIAIDPRSSRAHLMRSLLIMALGRRDEAVSEMETATRLDPSSASVRADLAWTYYVANRPEEALAEARRAVVMDDGSFSAHQELVHAYTALGRYAEAQQECGRLAEIQGRPTRRSLSELAIVRAASGEAAKAKETIDKAVRGSFDDPVPLYNVSIVRVHLGDKDGAFRDLRESVSRRLMPCIWMKVDPAMTPLRGDPRFNEILNSIGLGN